MTRTGKELPAPVLIDSRIGSNDLYPLLQGYQIPVEMCKLEFGDAAFMGNGPHGVTPVGIERKRIRDLVNSLMSARLAGHQLPGMMTAYSHAWLIVEGIWRTSPTTGLVETPRGGRVWKPIDPRITGAQLQGWLLTVELRGGIRVRTTSDPEETALLIGALHSWWTGKKWQEHRSHLALYQPPDANIFNIPSLVQQVAACIPGIGMDRSMAVDAHFSDVRALACAGVKEWRKIPGIGEGLAPRIVAALQKTKPA